MTQSAYETLTVTEEGPVARVMLARPQVRNAFNEVVIAELTNVYRALGKKESIRVIVLTGEGSAFSAGADLHWMRKMAKFTFEENLEDARALADMMETIYTTPKATIARVNGPAIGGGVGLVASCDITIASTDAFFSLSEVRVGLVPACIAPYVIRRVGEMHAREYFMNGKRFDAVRASEIGLVNRAVSPEKLDEEVNGWVKDFLHCGPNAIASCKELISRSSKETIAEVKDFTAHMIADLRVSDEGQEGISAFFEKRKPNWETE